MELYKEGKGQYLLIIIIYYPNHAESESIQSRRQYRVQDIVKVRVPYASILVHDISRA